MMSEITAETFLENLEKEVQKCADTHQPLKVRRQNGERFVVLAEKDWRAIEGTLHMNRIPGMVESIHEAAREPLSEGTKLEDLDW